jgi:hypothetical protein
MKSEEGNIYLVQEFARLLTHGGGIIVCYKMNFK